MFRCCPIHRRPRVVLSAMLLGVSLGCVKQAESLAPSVGRTWTREGLATGKVSLELPSHWTLSEAGGSALISPRPPEADDAVIVVAQGRLGVSALDRASSLLPLRDIQAQGASGSATLDGVGAVRFELLEVGSADRAVVVLTVWRMTATPDHVDVLRRIVASVRVEE